MIDRQFKIMSDILFKYNQFVELTGEYPDTIVMGDYYYNLLFSHFNNIEFVYGCSIIILPNFDYAFTVQKPKEMVELMKKWK